MQSVRPVPAVLAVCVACAIAAPAVAQEASQTLEQVNVKDKALHDDTRPKLEHIMKEVDGPLITVTKKTSITKLDNIPTVVDNNLRDLFAQTPGLYLSEQQTGSQFNLSYRGIGNPQESEFVSVMQDGIPLEGDWIGFPTFVRTAFAADDFAGAADPRRQFAVVRAGTGPGSEFHQPQA